jgi:2,3-bisphosphoglycerate-independent phosphoglycerate mutase
MKYLVILASSLSDRPIAERDNRTPLEIADTPNLDKMAQTGHVGSVQTIPESLEPHNQVSFLSLLGYDPEKYAGGCAQFEAIGLDVQVGPEEIPITCDFINLQSSHNDMVVKDYTADQLSSDSAKILLDGLQENITDPPVRFFPGNGAHNLMVIKSPPLSGTLTPPEELIGEGIRQIMPAGEEFEDLVYVMNQAQIILHNHKFNRALQAEGKDTVNSIWFSGNGPVVKLPNVSEVHGKSVSVITASVLLKGIAKAAGMNVAEVDGATGFSNSNFPGKIETALKELESQDVVVLHIGAAEEVSLKGGFDDKILAIEDFDSLVLGPIMKNLDDRKDVKILLTVNHGCSAVLMKYNRDRVPFLVTPSANSNGGKKTFDEQLNDKGDSHYNSGQALIHDFLGDKI